jgi:hypothetical protein
MSRVRVHSRSEQRGDPEPDFAVDDVPLYGGDPYSDSPPEDADLDPAAFAREARELARAMGEPLDGDFDDALRHIEGGADPEDVFGELDVADADPPEDDP